ncbi:hypothetical protein VUR80DRAFT_8896 [Thermomyces stellatus]
MGGNTTKTKLPISNLMSPPEPKPHENFTHGDMAVPATTPLQAEGKGKEKTEPMLSPPDSPAIATSNYIDTGAVSSRDPILYPTSRDYLSLTPSSLFAQAKQERPVVSAGEDLHRSLTGPVAKNEPRLFAVASSAKKGHELVGHMRMMSKLGECYNADRKRWRRQQRNQLKADREARIRRREREEQERRAAVAAKLRRDATTHRASLSPAAKPSDEIRVSDKALRPARPNRVTKPTVSRPRSSQSSNGSLTKSMPAKSTPEISPPADIKHSPGDGKHSDFESLEDYCPPLSSIPNKPNWWKIDWKGVPSVLTDDPNRHRLHPDEVRLAETLKLDCALYLAAKRRFFIRRLECARIKKPFRKTDAQQACRIDVNKASRLWTVYDRIGWLDEHWVKRFM